jgi:hypothetical protein
VFLELSATVGKSSDHNLGLVGVEVGMEIEKWVTGTPTHGGRQHIGHEPRGVRSESNYAMALDAASVLLELG